MINLSKFIQTISCLGVRLIEYRAINRTWRSYIENSVSRIKTNSNTYSVILECISYDKTLYDAQWYQRKILLRQIEREYPIYLKLRLPAVSVYDADLGDAIYQQYAVADREFPDEYYILLYAFTLFPSSSIKVFPFLSLSKFLTTQSEWLEQLILHMLDATELDNIIQFIPIVYIKNTTCSHYICYVNVVDSLIEEDFPTDSERFYMTTVKPDEDIYAILNQISLKIKQHDETIYLPKNVASELLSFEKLFIKLTSLVES